MIKKLIMSCMAVVAFAAVVLPATAMATNDPQLTDAKGLVTGPVKAHNTASTFFMATNGTTEQVVCSTASLTGEVTKNTGGNVEGTISTAAFSGTGAVSADNSLPECAGSFGNAYITVKNLPLTVKSTTAMATDEFQLTGSGAANVKFLIGSTTAGECEYESTSSIKGDFTTGTSAANDSVFTVRNTQAGSGSKLIRGGFLCPTSGQLKMSFTLETDVATTEGIWVS